MESSEEHVIVKQYDEDYEASKDDFEPNYMSSVKGHHISLDRNNIMIVG